MVVALNFLDEVAKRGDQIDVARLSKELGIPVVPITARTGEGLDTYRGVPTGGRSLSTRGITWHQLDGDGRIARETTYWNDTPVLQELGLPIITPESWVEGFDPAALAR